MISIKSRIFIFITTAVSFLSTSVFAREIQKMGSAISQLLGTPKAQKKSADGQDIFYSKGGDGKAEKAVVVEKGVWGTNCTHTWAIGVDPKSVQVTDIKIIELSCPHADPINDPGYLSQFKGKGPADLSKLSSSVVAPAKATGSSNLTIDQVKKAITVVGSFKGNL